MAKQKIDTNYACFCFRNDVNSKIITEIIENHSEFFGGANSWINFVSNRS